ncbi:hypothetical protein PybrP1_002524, partial [[Pythium] brassicae (nom. inval.)]
EGEIVVLRKTALKKVIANGWADVVISDAVLFTKTKADYPFKWQATAGRALQATASPSGDISPREVKRDTASAIDPAGWINPNWTILTPTSDKVAYSLDIQVAGLGFVHVSRVDGELLPEGSIGAVEVALGAVEVTSSAVSGREVLRVAPKNGSTDNSVNTSVKIHLAPNVDVADIAKFPAADAANLNVSKNLDKSFPDDAVTLFVNATGDFFVLANGAPSS